MPTCAQCKYYDFNDENSYDECYCSERCTYYSRGSSSCYSFEWRNNDDWCFITTVVVNILGYGDKCEHLQKLRKFRDNHMKGNPIYQPLLDEYVVVGPKIADAITNDPDKNSLALSLFDTYIKPVCTLLDKGEQQAAVELYKDMVLKLKGQFNL